MSRFHIVGLGGAGMSAIARLLLARGHAVTGSDAGEWPLARALVRAGAVFTPRFDAANVAGADVVVRSSAYREDHPEVAAARAAGVPVWRRQDAWRYLAEGKKVVAVAGTHGKTTTTALVFVALRAAGLDPSLVCGAELRDLGANAHAGQGAHLVIEADEYDRAFLELAPSVAVVTNVEHDHVDHFPTHADVVAAFREFLARVVADGALVACADDPVALELSRWFAELRTGATPDGGGARPRVATYGTREGADWRIGALRAGAGGTGFRLRTPAGELVPVELRLLGAHNARNAAAAIAAAAACGVPARTSAAALASFAGTSRRLETLGEARGIGVVDDYAHHPTEIRASIAALRPRAKRRVVVVFQPHTPSRLDAFFDEFAAALGEADAAVVVETFASAREEPDRAAGARRLAARVGGRYAATNAEAAELAAAVAREGDVVLVLGAGDVREAGELLLRKLRAPAGARSGGVASRLGERGGDR